MQRRGCAPSSIGRDRPEEVWRSLEKSGEVWKGLEKSGTFLDFPRLF
jgi:hypothetical protein